MFRKAAIPLPLVLSLVGLSLGVISYFPFKAFAATPKGAVALGSINIFQTSVSGKLYVCGNLPPYAPGKIIGGYFLPTKSEIKNLKSAIKKTTNSKKIKNYNNKIKALKLTLTLGNEACAISGGSSNPNFDIFGNVTAAGKAAFGIPATLNASVNAGITAWNQSCNGCHNSSPKLLSIKSFPAISQRITQSPMNFMVPGEISLEKIANIVAFANY